MTSQLERAKKDDRINTAAQSQNAVSAYCTSEQIQPFALRKAKRQYLLTVQVSRYCLLALHKAKRLYLLTCKVSRHCLLLSENPEGSICLLVK